MIKHLVFFALFSIGYTCVAQEYSYDASLVKDYGAYAVIESSGVGANKKEATEMAKKSVIYTYLMVSQV